MKTSSPLAPLDRSVYFLAAPLWLVHFLFNGKYATFRDELYYAACGEHLAGVDVDHAELVAFASWIFAESI